MRDAGAVKVEPAPGWYSHPERSGEEWYWDGTAWTASRWAEGPPSCPSRLPIFNMRRRGKFSTARFRVAFDGEWQGDFDAIDDAVEWAREISETGRMTWVVERQALFLRWRLQASFPQDRALEARKLWDAAARANAGGASG
jgi:hypothetical protein